MYSFNLAEQSPNILVRAADGSFYGTTSGLNGPFYNNGSVFHGGTVFHLTTGGVLTTLQTFNNNVGLLVLARDGNLFGTVINRGELHPGFVFRLSPDGVLTVVHNFAPNEGLQPKVLLEGKDGAIYGSAGVVSSMSGEVFQVTAAGAFSVVYQDVYLDPYISLGGTLIQAQDGNFDGVGTYDEITINGGYTLYRLFQLTPAGIFTTIKDLGVPLPVALMQGKDGGLYVTYAGDGHAEGGITRIDLVAQTVGVTVTGSASFQAGGPNARLTFRRTTTDLSRKLSLGLQFVGSAKNGVNFTTPDGRPVPKNVVIPAGRSTVELDLKAVADASQTTDLSLYFSLLPASNESYLVSDDNLAILTLLAPH